MPTTRASALSQGYTKYATDKACKNGHVTYRYTASGVCAQCAAEKAALAWAAGKRQSNAVREVAKHNWNASEKAKTAKQRWKDKDPKRAWAVYATGTAKARAKLAGIPFNLTSEYINSITPDCCPVFDTPFTFIGNKKPTPESATLDRLKPENGYTVGNVVVVSMKANTIKNAYTSQDIRIVADWLQEQGY